jgi:ligand-binding SRPBCC domain-containing protein
MKIFTLRQELWLPHPREQVFSFFADAGNLEKITPPWLRFEILTPRPITMRVGALIEYRIRLRRLPLRWRTEITAWNPPIHFTDEQRRGPYRLWIHEHGFLERDGGTLCIDKVRYAVLGGGLIEKFFVRRDVTQIFEFRRDAMTRLFSKASGPAALHEDAPP